MCRTPKPPGSEARRERAGVSATQLAELGLVMQTSEPMNAYTTESRLTPPRTMVEAALAADEGDVLPQVYQASGEQSEALFVGRLKSIEEADMARFVTERDAIRRQVTDAQRQEFVAGWVGGLQEEAGL